MIFIVYHTLFELFTYFNFLFHSFKQYRVITGNVAAKQLVRTITQRFILRHGKSFTAPRSQKKTLPTDRENN